MSVKIKSIKVEQAEGRTDRMISGVFPTMDKGCAALREIAWQCEPDMLGYLKTDVAIEWEDGTVHHFRCDVDQDYTDTNLPKMLRNWAERYKAGSTGPHLKRYLKPEQLAEWEEQAARIISGDLSIL